MCRSILLTNICRKNSDRKVREAAKVISDDLDEGYATDALKDSIVLSIHAEPEDIKQSCVYAVTINHNLKRVSVIFRGTSNMGDWIKDAIVLMVSSYQRYLINMLNWCLL